MAAVVALSMAACGKGGDPGASPSPSNSASASAAASASASKPAVKASSDLKAIKVTGAYGKDPKVSIPAPWAVDKTRTVVLKKGDGPAIAAGSTVTLNYAGYNGRTGKRFDDSFSRGAPATFNLGQVVPGFGTGLTGQKEGSRVLIAMPGKDGYDSSGGNSQIGVKTGDSLVFVVDIEAVPLTGPAGKKVTPKAGLPTVTDKAGVPEVKMPKSAPPSKLVVQPLIEGNGAKVTANDTITFNYRWYTWDGKLVEDSYGKQPGEYQLSGLLPGMAKGLAGQRVGSRVMIIVPPALGYPNGNANPKIDKGTTSVLVVDLLFASSSQ